ncbi:MAG: OstA-like protein [Halanaerobiaceae bacterium]
MILINLSIILAKKRNNNLLIFFISIISVLLISTSFSTLAETAKMDIWADSISVSENEESNVFLGEGNALLQSDDLRIEANLIQYSFDTEDFLAEKEVLFRNSDFKLRAGKISGSLSNEEFEAFDKVAFEADTLKIESNTANYHGNEGTINFFDDVVLSNEDIDAESDSLIYNEVEEKAYMEGNVKGTIKVQEGLVDVAGGLLEIDLVQRTWNISNDSQISYREQGE